MTLSFDSWEFFCCHWTFFFSPPLPPSTPSFSFSPLFLSLCLFLKVFNLSSKTGGVVERSTLNESLWNCSCVFDLRFSFLESGPRYWRQDVTSARARSNAVVKCTLARAHRSVCVSQNPLLQHLIMSKTDRKRDENPHHEHILTNFSGFKLPWQTQSLAEGSNSPRLSFYFCLFPDNHLQFTSQRSKSAWKRLKLIHPLRITLSPWHLVMSIATSWVWRRSNVCNTPCYRKWDFPSQIEKSLWRQYNSFKTIYSSPVAVLYFWCLQQHLSRLPLFLLSFCCLFSFVSDPLIQSFLNLVFLSTGAGRSRAGKW